jgi:hypothetical protein
MLDIILRTYEGLDNTSLKRLRVVPRGLFACPRLVLAPKAKQLPHGLRTPAVPLLVMLLLQVADFRA